MQLYDVIRRPLVTEKNTSLQAQGKYAFEIAKEANKEQVKNQLRRHSGNRYRVNILNVRGRERRVGRRVVTGSSWKKPS